MENDMINELEAIRDGMDEMFQAVEATGDAADQAINLSRENMMVLRAVQRRFESATRKLEQRMGRLETRMNSLFSGD